MMSSHFNDTNNFRHLEKILREAHSISAADKSSYSNKIKEFRKKGLPPIIMPNDLPLFLGISPKKIYSICNDEIREKIYYRKFELRKKNGSKREIHAPRTYLKVIQWWILDNILNLVPIEKNIFGFVLKRNIVNNAEFHLGSKHILNVDIKDFFPSITFTQVKEVFLKMGYYEDVSNMLAKICCLNNSVPQGAPTSPALGNIVLVDLDQSLLSLSVPNKVTYSRYADDLTFSSKTWIDSQFLKSISDRVKAAGFEINQKKSRFSGPQDRLEVTGVVINDIMQPRRSWRKRVRATLHSYKNKNRLTRIELSYLYGIIGVAGQYPSSLQMKNLSNEAKQIVKDMRHTVIGFGYKPALPNGLTKLEAEALILLSPIMTNSDMSLILKISEPKVANRLKNAYRKINAVDRDEAIVWAKDNL